MAGTKVFVVPGGDHRIGDVVDVVVAADFPGSQGDDQSLYLVNGLDPDSGSLGDHSGWQGEEFTFGGVVIPTYPTQNPVAFKVVDLASMNAEVSDNFNLSPAAAASAAARTRRRIGLGVGIRL
jgi:hypothetical protein